MGYCTHMKVCSKCGRDLPRECFVKSPRYLDGLVSACNECRKKVLFRRMQNNPLCALCKTESHLPKSIYCFRCRRIRQKRSLILTRTRDASNTTMCSRCKTAPRLKYHNYCKECKNKATREFLKRRGGSWRIGDKRKMLARAAVNRNVRRGRIKKTPCEVCGSTKSEGHHHAGYDSQNATNVRWLCKKHHDEAERLLKSRLTTQPLLL